MNNLCHHETCCPLNGLSIHICAVESFALFIGVSSWTQFRDAELIQHVSMVLGRRENHGDFSRGILLCEGISDHDEGQAQRERYLSGKLPGHELLLV